MRTPYPYPHLTAVAASYVLVVVLFLILGPDFFHALVTPFGLGGVFVAGMMYSYSVTTSAGALLLPAFLSLYSVPTIAILGGLGGTVADITILRAIRGNLKKEMQRLGATTLMQWVRRLPLMRYDAFRDILGILVIMSPIPDEVGIAIMASTHLSESSFRVLTLVANIIGIYILVSALAGVY
jgi:hypothetical protein